MKKYKVGVCGNFDTVYTIANGQTVKTINLWEKLCETYGEENVARFDTFGFKKKPISSVCRFLKFIKNCENVVMLPAVSAVKILVPIGARFKNKYDCKIHYVVVGAWLGNLLKNKKGLQKSVKKLDSVLVETKTLKAELEELGIEKTMLFPNFKQMEILPENELVYQTELPLKLCFFARVTGQKGVTELVETVKEINKSKAVYVLDIYGPVDDEYREEFEKIKQTFGENINYCGVIESNKARDTVKNYFLQVFPTKFKTEGIPGSIIDSYCAGVPVVASRWNSCHDIVDEGVTGISFELGNFAELKALLEEMSANPGKINEMKKACIEKAKEYDADNAMKILQERMEAKT